jgi:hypothetical protein
LVRLIITADVISYSSTPLQYPLRTAVFISGLQFLNTCAVPTTGFAVSVGLLVARPQATFHTRPSYLEVRHT